MPHEDISLTVILEGAEGAYDARLLELDIAVIGSSVDEVLGAFAHSIVANYEIAKEVNQTPFVGLLRHDCGDFHVPSALSQLGTIDVPDHVGEALAAVLHLIRPTRKISIYRKAA